MKPRKATEFIEVNEMTMMEQFLECLHIQKMRMTSRARHQHWHFRWHSRTSTLIVLAASIAAPQARPQSLASSTDSPNIQGMKFPLPTTSGKLGSRNQDAMDEISAHVRATGATAWQDLLGQGTLTYSSGDSHTATLMLAEAGKARLDIVMDSGTRSVRLNDHIGSFIDEKGITGTLLAGTSTAGIVAFPRLWTNAPASRLGSVFDKGAYTGTSQTLHRITIEYPMYSTGYTPGDPTVTTDLYFDPASHLLLFSVDAVSFINNSAQPLLRVTSYGSYQAFSGVRVPTVIQQSLAGQVQWTLQLNRVSVNTNPPASTFSF